MPGVVEVGSPLSCPGRFDSTLPNLVAALGDHARTFPDRPAGSAHRQHAVRVLADRIHRRVGSGIEWEEAAAHARLAVTAGRTGSAAYVSPVEEALAVDAVRAYQNTHPRP